LGSGGGALGKQLSRRRRRGSVIIIILYGIGFLGGAYTCLPCGVVVGLLQKATRSREKLKWEEEEEEDSNNNS